MYADLPWCTAILRQFATPVTWLTNYHEQATANERRLVRDSRLTNQKRDVNCCSLSRHQRLLRERLRLATIQLDNLRQIQLENHLQFISRNENATFLNNHFGKIFITMRIGWIPRIPFFWFILRIVILNFPVNFIDKTSQCKISDSRSDN